MNNVHFSVIIILVENEQCSIRWRIMLKTNKNKKEKEKRIMEETIKLFEEKGIEKTSIRDIMRSTKLGLGTFYLYFKDKKDLEEKIVTDVMVDVLYDAERSCKGSSATERYNSFIGYIIDYMSKNPRELELISKNLNWVLYSKVENDERFKDADTALKFILSKYQELFSEKHTEAEQLYILSLTMHIVISTCKSSMMEGSLLNVDEMKSVLFRIVEKIFR